MELNQIRDSRRLRIGQTLQIPADYSEARPRSRRSSERAAYESVANSNISSSPTSSALSPSAESFKETPTSLASNDEGFDVYEVRSGDNLEQIARRFGTNVSTLRRINGIRGSRINAGQKIKVPSRAKPAGSAGASIKIHRVRSGEHLTLIANRYGSSVAQIKKLNKLKKNTLVAGQKLKVPDARFKSYRVKHSDTL
jgi:LysM repeat protein